MSAMRLDGKVASAAVVERLKAQVAGLGFVPRLVFVRVGDDPASAYYVRSKERMAKRVGVDSETRILPVGTSERELLALVESLNDDPQVDGILVQLPIEGIDAAVVLESIEPSKDVDGLHPRNVGNLWRGVPALVPATPLGIVALCEHYGIEVAGAEAVIVGRSNLVGKPLAALLLDRNATVTVAHSKTRDLASITRRADLLVAAVGRPRLITADMVKPGAAVFDVGLTREGEGIVGDVHPAVAEVAGWLTPMPGGTGLMTVAMVIASTVDAAVRRRGAK